SGSVLCHIAASERSDANRSPPVGATAPPRSSRAPSPPAPPPHAGEGKSIAAGRRSYARKPLLALPSLHSRLILHRQADVVFGERGGSGPGAGDVVQVGELAPQVVGAGVVVVMQQGGHPPREALRFPDPTQADGRVALQSIAAAGGVVIAERM